MSPDDLLWFLLIFALLQPIVRKGMLESARVAMLLRLEKQRGSRVIALINRQESFALLGVPVWRFIDMHDSERILRAIRLTAPEMPIDLILHMPGDVAVAANQVASALARHPARTTVFIPHYAMSGASVIALAADEIVMTENAVFGAVDPQVGGYPAATVRKVVEAKTLSKVEDKTLVLADECEKAIRQTLALVRRLLSRRMEDGAATRIAEHLTAGRWTIDYPISVEELTEMGLTVSTKMPVEVLQLMNLYPQAETRRPSVDFLPVPYYRRESPQPHGPRL